MTDRTCSVPECEAPRRCRGMCNIHYCRWRRHGSTEALREMVHVDRTCELEGCEKPAQSKWRPICEMHQTRIDRHGDPHKKAYGAGPNIQFYSSTTSVGHPLATTNGSVKVHRLVLFNAIGPGLQACHWCAKPLHWFIRVGHPNRLTVDHLNAITTDNRLENLVPSCIACNVARGQQRMADLRREQGWWSVSDDIASRRRPRVEARRA